LCEALYYKADLGLRTRAAYKAGNRAEIALLISSVYKPMIRKIKEFYKAFAAYWDIVYKPHGFDVMDFRIGGVLQRLAHVMDKLSAYSLGKTDKIEELDEELLDFFGNGRVFEKRIFSYNLFINTATVNVI